MDTKGGSPQIRMDQQHSFIYKGKPLGNIPDLDSPATANTYNKRCKLVSFQMAHIHRTEHFFVN